MREVVLPVFENSPFGRKGEAVDGGVAFGHFADDFPDLGLAALVVLLADEEDGSADAGWLLPEQIEGVGEAVEDGGSTVAMVGVIEDIALLGDVGGEGRIVFGAAVKLDDGDFVWRPLDDSGEAWCRSEQTS